MPSDSGGRYVWHGYSLREKPCHPPREKPRHPPREVPFQPRLLETRLARYAPRMTPFIEEWKGVARPVIGMLHLLPLPGAPRYSGDLRRVADRMIADAEALMRGGVHGLMIENFGDSPFYPDRVPSWVLAHMTRLAADVRRRHDVPLGVNVLRNDGRSALAIAHAVGARFIRVNVLCGAMVTDQGIIQGIAYGLLRDRALLAAESIRILADVSVKHAAALGAARSLEDEVAEVTQRGGADGIVVTGSGTGRPADLEKLQAARAAAGECHVFVGSGVSPENVRRYAPLVDGLIVGSSLKEGGDARNPVSEARVRALLAGLAS